MKLPFNRVLSPLLKPHLGNTRALCHHPAFEISIFYTSLCGALGLITGALHFKNHLGESPPVCSEGTGVSDIANFMMYHDLKIITTSMGLVQNICLLIGCLTRNPSLFLPHLFGQIIVIVMKVIQMLLMVTTMECKILKRLIYNIPTIMLLIFNWCQEFCVFRQYLCICDL